MWLLALVSMSLLLYSWTNGVVVRCWVSLYEFISPTELTSKVCGFLSTTITMSIETALVSKYAGTDNKGGNAAAVVFLFLFVVGWVLVVNVHGSNLQLISPQDMEWGLIILPLCTVPKFSQPCIELRVSRLGSSPTILHQLHSCKASSDV